MNGATGLGPQPTNAARSARKRRMARLEPGVAKREPVIMRRRHRTDTSSAPREPRLRLGTVAVERSSRDPACR